MNLKAGATAVIYATIGPMKGRFGTIMSNRYGFYQVEWPVGTYIRTLTLGEIEHFYAPIIVCNPR